MWPENDPSPPVSLWGTALGGSRQEVSEGSLCRYSPTGLSPSNAPGCSAWPFLTHAVLEALAWGSPVVLLLLLLPGINLD